MRKQLITTLCVGLLATMPSFATKILDRGDHLYFGTVNVGNTVTRDLNLTNRGDENLTITDITFHEYGEGVYELGNPADSSFVLTPNESRLVPIKFTPTQDKSYNIAVYVESDKTNAGERDRILLGEGNGEVLPCSSKILNFGPHLNFGNVTVGLDVTRILTIKNDGDCDLNVTGISYHEYTHGNFEGNFVGIIPAHSSQNVDIKYTPDTVGVNDTGKLYVNSDRTNTSKERSRTLIGAGI